MQYRFRIPYPDGLSMDVSQRKSPISSRPFRRPHQRALNPLFTGSIREIDSAITQSQHLLSELPQSHPLVPDCGYILAKARFDRYALSNQEDDLDKAILHLTESILLPSRSWLKDGRKIFRALVFLAFALLERSKVSEKPEDAIYAAKYLRHIRDQLHQALGFLHLQATMLLVDALAIQVESKAGNPVQNIGEIAALCHELLTSDAPKDVTTQSARLISRLVVYDIDLWDPDQPWDQIIEYLQVARTHKPELLDVRRALVLSLSFRYILTCVNDDYEEVVSVLDEIITSGVPGDSQGEFVQGVMALLALIRSNAYHTPEYSEEAMYHARGFLAASSSPKEGPLISSNLEHAAKQRFHYFGPIEGLGASSGNSALSQPVSVGYEDDDSEFGRRNMTRKLLEGLLTRICNNDITDIDEAIEKGRTKLASLDPRDVHTSSVFRSFDNVLFETFKRANKIEYLNEPIVTCRQVLDRPSAQWQRSWTLIQLSRSLLTRYTSFPGHLLQDLDEGLELLSQWTNNGHPSLPERFRSACEWVSTARRTRHPSLSTAYESALSLMQRALLFAPTLQLQHATLATSDVSQNMPLDYASYQIDLGQLEEAIETLERGRALLWSEMRHLRTSVDQLVQEDPHLGHKFAAVNRDLEELTKSIPPSHKLSIDDVAADDLMAADLFGRLLLKQRRLLKERDKLISQIQALPGFDSFLTSPPFDTLRSAASSGPVIIINHSIWRSDILILLHDTSPSLIPTPHDFYDRATTCGDKLLDSRDRNGLDSSHYDQTLVCVLAELYKLVGKPVIDRLRQLKVPEQSRIWWCPTSVFCSLPLHAMGPIPSDDGEKHYFLDLYICSYTPTCPHSSNLVISSSVHDLRNGLPYYSSRSLTHLFQL